MLLDPFWLTWEARIDKEAVRDDRYLGQHRQEAGPRDAQ